MPKLLPVPYPIIIILSGTLVPVKIDPICNKLFVAMDDVVKIPVVTAIAPVNVPLVFVPESDKLLIDKL
jgi:hypothetical protein